MGFRVPRLDQGVEVTANAGRRQPEPLTDTACRDRAGLQQQLDDGTTGVTVPYRRDGRDVPDVSSAQRRGTDFHNISVTQFVDRIQQGQPNNELS